MKTSGLARNLLCLVAMLVLLAGCAAESDAPDTQESATAAGAAPEGAEVLTTGTAFRGINGIHFSPDNQLYITSVVTPALAVVDVETGEITQQWRAEEGAKGPDDVAFGPDGQPYWTDIVIGEVSRLRPDGSAQVIASLGAGVNPITFSSDGRLFVSQCFMDTVLYELDPEGQEEPRVLRDDLGPGCGLNGMDWGEADGKLYGPRWFRSEVVRLDVDSGEMETVADGFGVPAAVKFDSRGRLHVLDTLEGEVVRLDLATGGREVVGRADPGLDNLAFDKEDRLFVSSFADGSLFEVLGPDENRTILDSGVNMPGGIAVLPAGDLVLADFFALRRLEASSGQIKSSVRDVIGFSDLGSVMSVHASEGGERLALTSWFDNAVRIWNVADDSLISVFAEWQQPIDALFAGDRIAVSEWGTGSVKWFSSESPEERAVVSEGIDGPAGLAFTDGELFVSANGAGTVMHLASGDNLMSSHHVIADGLDGPEGIAVRDGQLYVVEAGAKQVTRIDLATEERSVLARGLDLQVPATGAFPNTMLFNGIALGDGVAYVSGDAANVIYTIDLDG